MEQNRVEPFCQNTFTVEEVLMRIGGYPDMDQQGRKHREFLLSLAEMERKSLQQDVSEEMADFLKGWISVHIMEDDKAFFMRS